MMRKGKWHFLIFVSFIASTYAQEDESSSTSPSTAPPQAVPSIRPSYFPTLRPTFLPPTLKPTTEFGRLVNGGFEDDAELVESKGSGFYSMLPSGWTDYRAAVMVSYALAPNHKQENSGDIFLSVFASHSGFITQNVSACAGMKFKLSFTAASYSCSGCSFASIQVKMNENTIFESDVIYYDWEYHNTSFISPGYEFSLTFRPLVSTGAQLLIDNIVMTHDGTVSCSPTSAPSTASPTSSPTVIPTPKPTGIPTGYPTGIEAMMVIGAQLTLEEVTYSGGLSEHDLSMVREVISSFVEPAAETVGGVATVTMPMSEVVDEKAFAISFDVEVLRGRYMDMFTNKYEKVFNATRDSLKIAFNSKMFLYALLSANTSLVLSPITAVSMDFYRVTKIANKVFSYPEEKHEIENDSNDYTRIILISLVSGTLILSIAAGIVSRMNSKRNWRLEDDEKKLLGLSQGFSQELELSEYVKSTAQDFEKVMSSSLHSLIPEQAP